MQNMTPTKTPPEHRRAYHEASHGVTADWRFRHHKGFVMHKVSIDMTIVPYQGGLGYADGIFSITHPDGPAIDLYMIDMAGLWASELLDDGASEDDLLDESKDDRARAATRSLTDQDKIDAKAAWIGAQSILWPRIVRFAEALIEKRTLIGVQIVDTIHPTRRRKWHK